MDQRPLHDELERFESGERTVSRRGFFNRARLGVLAVAGVALFGVGTSIGNVAADEQSGDEKKKSQEPRDKDREAKEKEQEGSNEEKAEKKKAKKAKKANQGAENTSNTKKKKKSKNGDDSKKKQKTTQPASPYAKYVEKGNDKYSCSAFSNQFDSQQVLRLDPRDPNNLDGNRNGIACDGQDAFMDGVPGGLMGSPFDINPVTRPPAR